MAYSFFVCHTARKILAQLPTKLLQKGGIDWPPKSTDLTPLEFFLVMLFEGIMSKNLLGFHQVVNIIHYINGMCIIF